MPLQAEQQQLDEDAIADALPERFGTREDPLDWPEGQRRINDFSEAKIQAMAFPTLFPYGVGDATNTERRQEVSLTDASTI